MVDRTNHIWSVNMISSCYDKISRIFLYMVDRTKRLASVGLAQARPNYNFSLIPVKYWIKL